MPIEPGTRLGQYEVLAAIPSGSPASADSEVRYKASDTQRHRVVALKVLPPEFAEPEMKARLERDSRTISSLNHPNICALVDVGHQDPSTDFFVTEYVEGETLAQRLVRGPLELQEALKVALALADSLDKTHRQGLVHGGINPSTIMLTAGGPKLLDFGLARAKENSQAPVGSSMATTRTSIPALAAVPAFAAPYMAPEQFGGGAADARSDIFAVGTVLYEMVTGKPAFQEKTQALLVAAVQSVDPDPVSKAQPTVPPALDHVIKRCLSKDPRQRLQTAWDLMLQLQWIAEGGTRVGVPVPVAASRQKKDRAVWAALATVSVLAAGMAPSAWSRLRSTPEPKDARFVAQGLPTNNGAPISISPDGRWIIASAGGAGALGVSALSLGGVTSQILINQNVITQAFWSPDSRSVGFFEDGKLKKVELSGGPSQNICETPSPIGGGTWNQDGVILFSSAGLIHRVPAVGGQPTAITALDESKQETEHLSPTFLPDGKHYVFLAMAAESAIYVGSIDSKDRTRLFAADSKAIYAAPGYLLFNRGTTLFAWPFDATKLALTGEPIRVADNVPNYPVGPNASPSFARFSAFTASQTGVLAFRTNTGAAAGTGGGDEQRSLSWFDRAGLRSAPLGATGTYAGVDLSPDGKRLAVHRHEGAGGDNWVFDLAAGRMQRLTFDTTQDNSSPVWSPDGTRIAFASRRNNKWGLYVKLADGTGTEELITESEAVKAPMSWSPDGKLLVYVQAGAQYDVWAVPVMGDKKPIALLQSEFNEVFPQVSPDGKWLAYQSNETGRAEIYIKPFPDGPGKWQVSTDGGQWPRWRRDGKELYFNLAPNFLASEIRVMGSSIQAGIPQTLFGPPANPSANINHANAYNRYAVSADGKSFLISLAGAGGVATAGGLANTIAALADRGGSAGPASAANAITVVVNFPKAILKK